MRHSSPRFGLLAAAFVIPAGVLFGLPGWFVAAQPWDQSAGQSAGLARSTMFAPHWAAVPVALHPHQMHKTDTVKPNGSSCPGAKAAPLVPPAVSQHSGTNAPDSKVPASPPDSGLPGPAIRPACPPTDSDARADIARGPSLAKAEPLNSPHLMAPGH